MTPFFACHRGGNRFSAFAILSMLAIAFVWIAAPLRAQFVYVANLESSNISAYSMGAHGVLTPVPGSPFAAGASLLSVAVDPTNKFAYVAANDNTVLAYAIGTNGALTPIPGSPFPAGRFPNSVAVDPTGKFVYVANVLSKDISAYHIRADGGLKPVTGSPFPTEHRVWALTVHSTGKFLYTANSRHNDVSAYSIGADGALTLVPGSPFAAGPNPKSIAVDPKGKFVYVGNLADLGNGSSVSGYSVGADGALTPVPGSPFTKNISSALSVTVEPTGKFAYVGNATFNQEILAYSIGANGALKLASPLQFAQGFVPISMAADPTGKFVCVANQLGNNVSVFRIGNDGVLTPPGSQFAAGKFPNSVAVSPLVPFASSSAQLGIHKDIFSLSESFTPGENSNGIDPVTEKVTLQIGTFSVTIPAGSFKLNPDQSYSFQGVINGVSTQVSISKSGERLFILDAVFTPLDLSGITNPETVVLTFGIDSGSTAATVIFD